MEKRPILVQGAMIVEVKDIINTLENSSEESIGCWGFYKGTIDGYPVIVSKTEMGMTNSAAATALAIEKYNPLAIINQGTAGAHAKFLNKYDIIIGTKAVNIGSLRSDFKDEGLGFDASSWLPLKTSVVVDGKVRRVSSFQCDKALIEAAKSAIPTYTKGSVYEGTLASGDQWNKELDRLLYFNSGIGTLGEDMETASCAQIAMSYKVPFVGIRVISNNEHRKEAFAKDSCDYCQNFIIETLRNYIKTLVK